MPAKKLIMLFAALLLAASLLCACGGQDEPAPNNTEPVKLSPDLTLADGAPVMVHYLADDKLLVGYYRYGEAAEDNAKLSVMAKGVSTVPIYVGHIGDNAFFDVKIRDLDDKIVLHQAFENTTALLIDKQSLEVSEVSTEAGSRFVEYIDADRRAVLRDNRLEVLDGTGAATVGYDLPHAVIDYAVCGDMLAMLDLDGTCSVVNTADSLTTKITPSAYPDGWGGYTGVDFTADGKYLVFTVWCEADTAFQVVDRETGEVIARYTAANAESRLLAVMDESLVILDGEKLNATLVNWHYLTDQAEDMLRSTDIYDDGAYIADAAVNNAGSRLICILQHDGESAFYTQDITE